MVGFLLMLLGVSFFVCAFSREWARTCGLLRENSAGWRIPTGVAFCLIGLQAVIILMVLGEENLAIPAAAVGFAVVGLYDDFSACSDARQRKIKGWHGHMRQLAQGSLTSGAVKLLGGGVIAAFTVGPAAGTFIEAVRNVMIVALSANFINGLDLAPGRAVKGLMLVSCVLTLAEERLWGPAGAVLVIPLVVFAFGDLCGRYMMGDAGANGWGAMLGAACVTFMSSSVLWILLGFLCVAQFLADGVGFSTVIQRSAVLSYLDRLGRPEWK